ncbi:adenylate/guanylate cyclase domain-containing protein [soil metagenome]
MMGRPGLWRVLRLALLAALVLGLAAHAAGFWRIGWITRLDLAIADARLIALMPRTLDPRIVIVDVDEKSLAEVGRWPWGRDRMAALADALFVQQKAAVVGFDMLFPESDASSGVPALARLAASDPVLATHLAPLLAGLDHDALFARSLTGRAAVLGYYLTSDRAGHRSGVLPAPVFGARALHGKPVRFTQFDGYSANLPVFAAAAPGAGFFNNVPDADGVVRSLPLIAELDGRHYESLALAMFRRFTGEPAVGLRFPSAAWLPTGYGGVESVELTQGHAAVSIPVDSLVRVRVPYRGHGGPQGGSFEYVSAADVLSGRLPAAHLAGKLVLVGSTAPGLYDQRSSPVGEVFPGVEVHANLISGLLEGRLAVEPDWAAGAEIAQLLVLAALMTALLGRLGAVHAVIATPLALVAAVVALDLWLYAAHGLALPLASSLLLITIAYAGGTVGAYIVVGRSRRSLARLFGTYVPPELVEEMARDPARYDMRAENRVLTVMFCDMRNFTRVSELLSPEDVRALVNRFFSTMTAAIRSHRGTLDKYIGDAIMAFWGAPVDDAAHAANAVHAALEMADRLRALNAELGDRGLPQIGLGIGLNTGLVCVGDMGSDIRRSYTVMGDSVNLASRIEALTRYYGVDVLAGEATRLAAGDAVAWVEVDRVRVKGKQQAVTLFTPVSDAARKAPCFEEEMRLWQLVLQSVRRQHWDSAQSGLESLQNRFGDSCFSGLYDQLRARVANYRSAPPPPDWDGALTFDTK